MGSKIMEMLWAVVKSLAFTQSERNKAQREFGTEEWSRGVTSSDLYFNKIFELLRLFLKEQDRSRRTI